MKVKIMNQEWARNNLTRKSRVVTLPLSLKFRGKFTEVPWQLEALDLEDSDVNWMCLERKQALGSPGHRTGSPGAAAGSRACGT